MPLIHHGPGYILVCLNGCVSPNITTGFDRLSRYATGQKISSYGQILDEPMRDPTKPPTTMLAVEGARGVVAVTFPETGSRVPGSPNARQFSIQEWIEHRQPKYSVTEGTPVLLYVCSVCGYTEMYHAATVDKANAPQEEG